MFALVVLICMTGKPCDVDHSEAAYVGKMIPLAQCQSQAIPILKALPRLPDGQLYSSACAGKNYVDRVNKGKA